MATGNPLLAVLFEDGYVRTYEWVPISSEFVQIAARDGYVQAPENTMFKPQIHWGLDSSQVIVTRNLPDSFGQLLEFASLTPDLVPIFEGSYSQGVGGYQTDSVVVSCPVEDVFYMVNNEGWIASVLRVAPTYIALTHSVPSDFESPTTGRRMLSAAATPDASILVYGTSRPKDTVYWVSDPKDPENPDDYPTFLMEDSQNVGTFINADISLFSKNGKFLLIADKTGIAEIYVNSGAELTIFQTVPLPVGELVSAAFSGDNRHMAISSLDGGVYTTRVYSRQGAYYKQEQDIVGVGQLLDFTQDGSMLIDARGKKAYLLDQSTFDSWTEIAGALSSVNSNGLSQAVSTHTLQPVSMGYLYDHAINRFKNDLVDLNNLRLTLLTSNATFVHSHTTFEQTTNSWADAVSAGGYPAEGMPITYVNQEDQATRYVYHVEAVIRDIVDEPMTARYAVIHEGTGELGAPLIFIDLGAERTIAKNTKLTLDFRAQEMLILN